MLMAKGVRVTMKAAALVVFSGLGFLVGCAPQPENVVASYVSPNTYSNYSCKQIISERNVVVGKVNELNGIQEKKANDDAVAVGVATVLFWPAAFLIAGGSDVSPQLATMKGNYDALTAAGKAKNCF